MAALNKRYEELSRELDIRQLMQQARAKSGLSDFGDETFVEPLRKLLDCRAHDTNFHPAGLNEFKLEVVRDLVNRLRFEDDLKRHPEILDEDVSDPIIILGLPRSGTTKTHRMMGTDPTLLKTYTWQLMNPARFPDAVPGQEDPRIAAASYSYSLLAGENPDVQAGHHMAVLQLEEDWVLFEHTFNDWFHNNLTPSRSWQDWVMSRSEPADLGNYQYVRSLIQYLQWQQGGRQNRRWLMKNTGHLAHMEELINVYPKATLVHIHRHPRECLASFAKFVSALWSLRLAELDPASTGELILDWEKTSLDRYMKTRDRLGLDNRIFDVQYEQIRSNPMPVFREIYRCAGHTLSTEAERGMMQWENENEQGKHGKHVYSLEEFGLSDQKINEAFGEYIKRFIQ